MNQQNPWPGVVLDVVIIATMGILTALKIIPTGVLFTVLGPIVGARVTAIKAGGRPNLMAPTPSLAFAVVPVKAQHKPAIVKALAGSAVVAVLFGAWTLLHHTKA